MDHLSCSSLTQQVTYLRLLVQERLTAQEALIREKGVVLQEKQAHIVRSEAEAVLRDEQCRNAFARLEYSNACMAAEVCFAARNKCGPCGACLLCCCTPGYRQNVLLDTTIVRGLQPYFGFV